MSGRVWSGSAAARDRNLSPPHEPIRCFEPFKGYRVVTVCGEGVRGNPFREVTSYFTEDGGLIAHFDNYAKDAA